MRLSWHVLRHRSFDALLFLISGAIHAASHGAVAWCAALLGRALVSSSIATPDSSSMSVSLIASMGLVAVVAKGGTGIAASFSQARLAAATGQYLRDTTVRALLRSGPSASAASTLARIVTRIHESEDAVQRGVFAFVRAIAQLVPIGIALWVVSPNLTLGAILVLAPFSIALSKARRRARALHDSSMQASDALHEEMDDLVRHTDLWRTYGTGERARTALARLGRHAARARVRSETLGVALSSANEVLGAAALIAVLTFASRSAGWLDNGQVIAFITLFFMAYRPLRDLGDARSWLVRGAEALCTLDAIAVDSPSTEPSPCPSPRTALLLSTSALRVPERTPALTLRLDPGVVVAVAGRTGSGKTTLLRALMGLEPDAVGSIRYGDQVLEAGQVGPAYRPFAWVPQDAPVISGTLDDNMMLAGADRDRANAELEAIGASTLRDSLGDDRLGGAGRTLSGGERRWVALARALATGLPIMVLDEPTVGLDSVARAAVMQLLHQLRGRRSVLVATHDDDVLAIADRVIWIGEGHEDGPRGAHASEDVHAPRRGASQRTWDVSSSSPT